MPRLTAVAALVAGALAASGCGEKSEPDLADLPPPPPPTTTSTSTGQTTTETTTSPEPDSNPPDQPRATPLDSVRAYFAGLSLGDGTRVCTLLAPGAITEVKLPKPGGGCAAALSRSIGYHDPKGPPAFKSADVQRIRVLKRGEHAKAVARVVTRYVDERRPSIDDDIVYLKQTRAGWLILKPSAILYRAVGLEPPLAALKPPA